MISCSLTQLRRKFQPPYKPSGALRMLFAGATPLQPAYASVPAAARGFLASQDSQQPEKRTVRAGRRRPRGSTEPSERERAEAPRRRRTERAEASQAPPHEPPRPSTGGQAGPPPSSWRPSGGRPQMSLMGILLIGGVLVLAFLAFAILGGGGDSDDGYLVDAPDQASQPYAPTDPLPPTEPPPPTRTPGAFIPPSTSGEDQTWLVMLYQDADDKILEQDIILDLNEAERIGSSGRVQIVAQVDRFRGGFDGDGNWTSTKRFYVEQDPVLGRLGSTEIMDLGEANMADGDTLVDFVTWAIDSFPADKHVLILSDHGMGWPGGWTDPEPGGRGAHNIALADNGDELFLMELDEALQEIRERTGLAQFEMVGLDACLMGHVEVFDALAPHARYAVASQETEPALGWAYAAFLGALARDPDMDGAELGRQIVDSYVRQDERIVDDQARAEFLRQGAAMSGFFGMLGAPSAAQLASQMEDDVTLTAVDLDAIPGLINSLNDLAYALQGANQRSVAGARTYAQSFTSVFGQQVPPSYIDLGNFAQLVARETGDADVARATDRLMDALDQAVLAERHGRKKPGATGVSIYFPNSQLYGSRYTGPESYTTVARRFAADSLWDDYLAYHYTGRPFDPAQGDIAVPDRGAVVAGPGAGRIEVSPIQASSDVAAPGEPILLQTEITGDNLGYVYIFAGYLDEASNSIWVADTDYLETDGIREIDGVYYPDWGEGGILELEFEWEPIVYAVNDGVDQALALFAPEDYGASPEEAVYSVQGIYTFADGSGSRNATLSFSDGMLKQVYGFTGQEQVGAPREILPEVGDTFTVLERWIDLGASGQAVQYATQEGDTITFGEEAVTWEEMDAPIGEYVVGFIVEDLDGNDYQQYVQVTVE